MTERKVLDVDRPCELSAEECTALSEVLKCKIPRLFLFLEVILLNEKD